MQVRFWGTRGSIAKPGRTTERYGGNTSCIEVRSSSGTLIVIDCGTGAHDLGQHLAAANRAGLDGNLLISHTHWDHIQGLPFFAPLFMPAGRWRIFGPGGLSQSLRATLAGQMEHTYFPITLDQFAAKITFHDLVEGEFSIEDVTVKARYLNHPALTLGYRLEADGASVVYCCDHEPHSRAMASGDAALTGMDRRHAEFLAGADLVIHDSQYTAREYPAKIGWGHSPVEYAVRACQDAGVKRLALTHHDPLRDDASIDRILEQVRSRLRDGGSTLEVLAAAEGTVLELSGGPAPGPAKRQFEATSAVDGAALTRPVLLHLTDAQLIAQLLEALDSECIPHRVVGGGRPLTQAMAEDNPSLVLIEHNPPQVDGLAAACALRRGQASADRQVPLVLVTASAAAAVATQEDGATFDWLVAPFSQSYARARIRSWVLRAACRWVRAQTPADEVRRLAALQELAILDTPAEERFDRLTRIAAAALDVPIALVSLVDRDRQWFKSCFGLDTRETSREVAFCAHVVHQKKEMVVPDTLLDDRFADNPLVHGGPRIRAYTGAPLVLDDDSCIGTFCVIDTRPRQFNEAELAMLRDLRDLALQELSHARAVRRPEPAVR